MTCLGHYCLESEYKAEVTKSEAKATKGENDRKCDTEANKNNAIKQAETELQNRLAELNEKNDEDCKSKKHCTCGKMPEWPKDGGWTQQQAGEAREIVIIFDSECVFTVKLTFTLLYRERRAPCIRKIPEWK